MTGWPNHEIPEAFEAPRLGKTESPKANEVGFEPLFRRLFDLALQMFEPARSVNHPREQALAFRHVLSRLSPSNVAEP